MHDPTRLPIRTLCQPTIRVSVVRKTRKTSWSFINSIDEKIFIQQTIFFSDCGFEGVNCEKPRCKDGCHPQNVSIFFLSATIWQVNFSYWAHAAGRYIVGSLILVLRTCFANLCRGSVIYLMNAVVSLVGLERTARSVWRPSPASTEHVRNPLNATATKAFSEPIATVPYQL